MHLLSLLWRCHLAGTNGPDWLIGDHDLVPLSLRQRRGNGLHLLIEHVEGRVRLALLQLLANAGDGGETVVDGKLGLVGHHLARLSAVLTTLAVTQDHPVKAVVLQHGGRRLASPGTRGFVPQVLCSNSVVRAQCRLHLIEVDERGRHDDLNILSRDLSCVEIRNELLHTLRRAICLPVAADEELPRSHAGSAEPLASAGNPSEA
mmetsp:Transcript_17128/g.37547  ORF Transcript_17128/g.37547 Transcript_17128/m.37547 type:complete len:205 (+) Transcript_17128:405-1019(+)